MTKRLSIHRSADVFLFIKIVFYQMQEITLISHYGTHDGVRDSPLSKNRYQVGFFYLEKVIRGSGGFSAVIGDLIDQDYFIAHLINNLGDFFAVSHFRRKEADGIINFAKIFSVGLSVLFNLTNHLVFFQEREK